MRELSRKPIPEELLARLGYDPESGAIIRLSTGAPTGRVHAHSGYIVLNHEANGRKTHYAAHRVAWALFYKEIPPTYIDHINGDKTDNRIKNLRESTSRKNQFNTKKHREGLPPGVTYEGEASWSVKVGISGKKFHLGSFGSKDEAVLAHADATRRLEAIEAAATMALREQLEREAATIRAENKVRKWGSS